MPGPLEGIRVIELGVWVAGPAAGGILADWGADVVKIEPPTGDPARQFMGIMGGDLPINPPFELDNRSKRSIVVDLTTEEGHEVALDLLADADVFLTNVRMDALERLGLDHEAVCAHNPRLVYGIITGYGTAGEERDRAAYDVGAFWARSGIASVLTPPGGAPPFQRGGMGDHGVAMDLAGAVCAALVARDKQGGSGAGQLVSTSLLRHGMYTIGFDINTHLRMGVPIGIGGHAVMANPAMNWYRTSDESYVWLIGLEGDRHWPALCRAVGHPEWIDDPRFHDAASRRAQRARDDRGVRRGVRDAHPGRVGRGARRRRRVVGTGADHRGGARRPAGLGRRRVPRGPRRVEHGDDGQLAVRLRRHAHRGPQHAAGARPAHRRDPRRDGQGAR